MSTVLPPVPRSGTALRPRDVADLTMASGYPCLSLLLTTEPGPQLVQADRVRLESLVGRVEAELSESGIAGGERLLRRLRILVDRVCGQPADRGLAIYVSLAVERVFRLPSAVTERAVVERTFATRDLVHALHRTPPHAVLVIEPESATLFQAMAGDLALVARRERGSGRVRGPRRLPEGAPADSVEEQESYLADVDRMLGSFREDHPSPLVLAGSPPLVTRFVQRSRHLTRLAGRVPGDASKDPEALGHACQVLLEDYLRSRRQEALGTLAEALDRRPGDVAVGIASCWEAVHRRRPQLLLVEESYVSPGTAYAGAVLADGVSEPPDGARDRFHHDLVDDLIEILIVRGGHLALVRDGELGGLGRVALVSAPVRSTSRGR